MTREQFNRLLVEVEDYLYWFAELQKGNNEDRDTEWEYKNYIKSIEDLWKKVQEVL